MNTGIQDAYNLAWKLAFVVRGYAGEKLLETYNEERLKNAQRLLETTDRLFELAAGSNRLLSLIRTNIFPHVAGQLVKLNAVRKRLFPLISQIGINYRGSSLSGSANGARFKVKAGDRMPYFLIDGQSIYDRLREPKFHLLTFSDEEGDCLKTGDGLEDVDSSLVDCQRFPLRGRAAEVFGTDAPFAVLLRPDNYVAHISQGVSSDSARAYLRELAG
jgi:hypothetical protein